MSPAEAINKGAKTLIALIQPSVAVPVLISLTVSVDVKHHVYFYVADRAPSTVLGSSSLTVRTVSVDVKQH